MRKGIHSLGTAIAVALSLAAGSAAADPAGCAVLAEKVKADVAEAVRLQWPADRAPRDTARGVVPIDPAARGRFTCSSTAAVASRAFTEALDGLDVRLSWNDDWIRPGDVCLSHLLSQCYPSQDPLRPLPPPDTFAFVHRTWQRIAKALESQMPYGPSGDLASFTGQSLSDALSIASHAGTVKGLRETGAADRRRQAR